MSDERDDGKPGAATASPSPASPVDARTTILARRASFVAAAMVGIACGKSTTAPETPPMVCLSVSWVPPDAALSDDADTDASPSADAGSASTGVATDDKDASASLATSDGGKKVGADPQPIPTTTAIPRPCLRIRPPTKPPSKQ